MSAAVCIMPTQAQLPHTAAESCVHRCQQMLCQGNAQTRLLMVAVSQHADLVSGKLSLQLHNEGDFEAIINPAVLLQLMAR